MGQNYFYPPSLGGSNPSVGTDGSPIPLSSTLVGAEDGSGLLQPLQVDASGNLKVDISSSSGSPFDVNLTKVGGTSITLGQKVMASSLPITIASNQTAIPVNNQDGAGTAINSKTLSTLTGLASFDIGYTNIMASVFNDYTSVAITTAAYVELVASSSGNTREIEIFDSSGQALYFATGAAGVENNQFIIFPGGNGRIKLALTAGQRLSAKAITGTANVGFLAINFYG